MQPQSTIPCAFPGCERFAHAKNLCKRHYEQARVAAIPDHYVRESARLLKWRLKNPERSREIKRKYALAHVGEYRAKDKIYRKTHPATDRVLHYTAKIKGAKIVERVYRGVVFARDGGRCHVCGELVDPEHWHIDHLIPLSKGGEHSYLNVAVSHPLCNDKRFNTGPAQLRLFGLL